MNKRNAYLSSEGNAKSMRAAFVSAGGYHHHLGLNTWQGEGALPPPPDAVGLRYFTVELPNQKTLDEVVARIDKAGFPPTKRKMDCCFMIRHRMAWY